jgi:hypothetical protein
MYSKKGQSGHAVDIDPLKITLSYANIIRIPRSIIMKDDAALPVRP